jgi:hypothetical protein
MDYINWLIDGIFVKNKCSELFTDLARVDGRITLSLRGSKSADIPSRFWDSFDAIN